MNRLEVIQKQYTKEKWIKNIEWILK
jgi:hypothetical protein